VAGTEWGSAGKQPDWLHAPASGPFGLMARICWPADTMPGGTCKLPPVTSIGESTEEEEYGS
jgi:hypothetical protein